MIPIQFLGARTMAGLVALALGLMATGCSSHRSAERAESAPPVVEPAAESAPADDLTATEAALATDSVRSQSESSAAAGGTSSSLLNPNAPKSYTVKRGDTLWGIATLFLRDPWLWPEVWYVNPQVENPHLIYPGDVLALAYGADGRPQIRLERGSAARLNPRLRSTPLDGAIPPIPFAEISAFLSRPSLLSKEDVKAAPHVVAFRGGHMIAGSGMDAYVRGLDSPVNGRYSVIHIGDPIRDPDDGDVVGYNGIYSATAVVTKPGEPAKTSLTDSARETLEGDRLFAIEQDIPQSFSFTAPRSEVEGSIIAVADGVQLIGQYQIVVINRGARHGLEVGNVLAVDQAGDVVRDRRSTRWGTGSAFAPKVKLPNERTGTLLVFKTYERVSYGLIVGASDVIHVADVVRSP